MLPSLSHEDIEIIYELVESLIGSDQSEGVPYGVIIHNIAARMQATGFHELGGYLGYVRHHNGEFEQLIHSLTIHTTRWFCSHGQFDFFAKHVRALLAGGAFLTEPFRLWSAACSSGQEAYGAAMILEELKQDFPHFTYEVIASDIDPLSIAFARHGVYEIAEMEEIPRRFHDPKYVLASTNGRSFKVAAAICAQITFTTYSLLFKPLREKYFDFILCRHVLQDYLNEKVRKIVKAVTSCLRPDGVVMLGQGERLVAHEWTFTALSHRCYQLVSEASQLRAQGLLPAQRRLAVLIVDDEADFRDLASEILTEGNLVCYGVGSIPHALAELAVRNIDLVLCDISMPGINGFEGVSQLRGYGFAGPIVILSTYDRETIVANFSRLGTQAQEYIEKQRFFSDPVAIAAILHAIARKYQEAKRELTA